MIGFAACTRGTPRPLPPPTLSTGNDPTPKTVQVNEAAYSAPQIEALIEPALVGEGESAILRWTASEADRVEIDHNIGPMLASGRIKLFPEESTTYRLVAYGPGGTAEKEVVVTVQEEGAPALSHDDASLTTLQERFDHFIKPVFFAFDSAQLSRQARIGLEGNLQWFRRPENSHLRILIQGHCDQRGSEEYNLALGDSRAQKVRLYLIERGLDPRRVAAITLGEERPFSLGNEESHHALNRRAHFVLRDQPEG